MPICIHCHKEFTPKSHQGKRKCCYSPECAIAEKERRKKMNKAWYLREQAKGRFKQKQQNNKLIKPELIEKMCMKCHKSYIAILGKGDSVKWGICPRCKGLQAYHYSQQDYAVDMPGAV